MSKKRNLPDIVTVEETRELNAETSVLMGTIFDSFRKYAQNNKKISADVLSSVERAEYPDKLIDIISANINFKLEKKMEILSFTNTKERLEAFVVILETENEMLGLQNKINARVKQRIEKNQREYFLNEQLKQIHRELICDEKICRCRNLRKGKGKNPPQGGKSRERVCKASSSLSPNQVLAHSNGLICPSDMSEDNPT